MAQWSDGAPYSSNRHGFPAAAQAAPCVLAQRLPQSYDTPPGFDVSFDCGGHRGAEIWRRTAAWVEVEGAEIDRVDGEVCGEVEPFAKGKGITSIGSLLQAESL
jgi:hypothetical protein